MIDWDEGQWEPAAEKVHDDTVANTLSGLPARPKDSKRAPANQVEVSNLEEAQHLFPFPWL